LSTEGVYSRDMGRGNSTEGGRGAQPNLPPPAPPTAPDLCPQVYREEYAEQLGALVAAARHEAPGADAAPSAQQQLKAVRA